MALPEGWQLLRAQMPITERWAYLDHAAVAPLPGVTRDVIVAWAAEAASEGNTAWLSWSRRLELVRDAAARLIGADRAEIALVHSTTEGISLVAEGYPWREGDNVVTLANEFPSNLYPWMNLAVRGVETRRVEAPGPRVDVDRLLCSCDARTRIVSVSWVGYASGWRLDLDRLAEEVHRRGVLLFVDAIQGLGAFPLNVGQTQIDFLAADGHKWLLGPEGAGLLYIRRQHLDRLRPLMVGWNSVVHASDYTRIELDLKPSAARYEGGSPNMVGFLGLGASLELLLECGIEAIAERTLEITDLACRKLEGVGAKIYSAREGDHRSGIVSFDFGGDPLATVRHCQKQGVVLRARNGRLRISPHGYNNEEDIDRLIAALRT